MTFKGRHDENGNVVIPSLKIIASNAATAVICTVATLLASFGQIHNFVLPYVERDLIADLDKRYAQKNEVYTKNESKFEYARADQVEEIKKQINELRYDFKDMSNQIIKLSSQQTNQGYRP